MGLIKLPDDAGWVGEVLGNRSLRGHEPAHALRKTCVPRICKNNLSWHVII